MRRYCTYILILITMALSACNGSAQDVKSYGFKVEEALPHDVTAYTQGLFFHEGQLYESAGQYGESSFRKVDLKSGKVLQRENFDGRYFVEGSCVLNGRLYILTWRESECFVYDIETMKRLGTIRYTGEGWGLTTDGKSLIMSDGSSKITFRNPETFVVEREITVTKDGQKLPLLNELEYIKGEIWANIYTYDIIARIDPETGKVKGLINCSGLLPASQRTRRTDVLNGIAYDEKSGSIYLTGKYWPKLYKVKIVGKK